jgi:hypothetical protein
MSPTTRELAQRLSGSQEIQLLWDRESGRVEVAVHDVTTGVGFHLEVEPRNAMDAFYHPYAYAASLRRDDYWRRVAGGSGRTAQ